MVCCAGQQFVNGIKLSSSSFSILLFYITRRRITWQSKEYSARQDNTVKATVSICVSERLPSVQQVLEGPFLPQVPYHPDARKKRG